MYEESVRQNRVGGSVAIVLRRYSPGWWDEDRTKPSSLRQVAYKHQPQLCVFFDDDGPRQFVAFGGMTGANEAMDCYFGHEVTTKADLDNLLCAGNRKLLDILPDEPSDDRDLFVFGLLGKLARNIRGCGFDAIQATVKLEAIREMSYADIRAAAALSPEYVEFVESLTTYRANVSLLV